MNNTSNESGNLAFLLADCVAFFAQEIKFVKGRETAS